MMRLAGTLAVAGFVAFAAGCRDDGDRPAGHGELLERRDQRTAQRAASASEGGDDPVARWILPDALREISGVALTSDGRILAHNDEHGRVYVIDPRRGVILKHFSLGSPPIPGDFEGIAVSGDEILLLTSNGRVYRFREGDAGANVRYTVQDTGLGKECEFEGIEVEAGTGALLLLCKVIDKKSERNQLLIFRWLPQSGRDAAISRISVPLAEAAGSNGWKELSPSDITIDPVTGNYVIIAAREKALIEITPDGSVVRSMPLPGSPQQPEGVAITSDGLLVISDESVVRPADITLYPWRRVSDAGPIAANQ